MKINGHEISLGNVLTIIGMLAALGATWGTLSADAAATKQRVGTVEKRQEEDREQIRRDQREIKDDVKDVKSDVQQIRLLLEGMKRERGGR